MELYAFFRRCAGMSAEWRAELYKGRAEAVFHFLDVCSAISVSQHLGQVFRLGKYPYPEYPSIQQAREKWDKWDKWEK